MSEQSKAVRERLSTFAAEMGRAGRGASKVRGDSDHYRTLVARRKDRIRCAACGDPEAVCECPGGVVCLTSDEERDRAR